MTLSREQAQSLTHTLHLLRPSWSEAGIYAALAKVAERDAFEVALAAIRAAQDPKVQTPGVIPTTGSHWNEPEPKPISEPKLVLSRAERRALTCAECGRESGCAVGCPGFTPLDHAARSRSQPPSDLRTQLQPTVTFGGKA